MAIEHYDERNRLRAIFDKNVAEVEAAQGAKKYNTLIDVDTFLHELHWVAEISGSGCLNFYHVELAIQNTLEQMGK